MLRPIYMDCHATTPVDPRVLTEMIPYFTEHFGNPSSHTHRYGAEARDAVEQSRAMIARCINASPEEIIFTSGATDANNLAIRGCCPQLGEKNFRRGHFVSVVTEHHAVLEPIAHAARQGHEYTLLHVNPHRHPEAGLISLDQLDQAFRSDTLLVSTMMANNVIGAIQPLREIAQRCRERGVLLHTDATQAAGILPIDVRELDVDYLSLSAHKMYGPKGVGALFVRNGIARRTLRPQIEGGRQEGGMRGGTLNVPSIVGFAKAFELSVSERARESQRVRQLRDTLADRLSQSIDELEIVGPSLDRPELRLPNNLNCIIPGISSAALLQDVASKVALSNGSACVSDNTEPSHVLVFLGLDNEAARSSVRFGLGRFTTEDDIQCVVAAVAECVANNRRRQPAPVYNLQSVH